MVCNTLPPEKMKRVPFCTPQMMLPSSDIDRGEEKEEPRVTGVLRARETAAKSNRRKVFFILCFVKC